MIYLNFVPEFEKGVKKKIGYQKKALEKLGEKIVSIEIKNSNYCVNDLKILPHFNGKNFLSIFLRKINNITIFYMLKKRMYYSKETKIYIRYLRVTPIFIGYLKYLKSLGLTIILEIPTYPYDNESQKNILSLIDKIYRKKLKNFVDWIVTYSEDKTIFEIPCINIYNGIDLEEVKLIEREEKVDRKLKKIIFTSVSNCSFWHGIDRFLFSLEEYYEKNGDIDILFNIVGEGNEKNKLEEIVEKSKHLKEKIIFHGFLEGEKLDKIYEDTNIAVGCLGNHRKKVYTIQALKNKEYAAKGLPMIFSEDDPSFRNVPFIYRASHDDIKINIEEVLKWYKELKITKYNIRDSVEKFSWNKQMKEVIKIIEGEKE